MNPDEREIRLMHITNDLEIGGVQELLLLLLKNLNKERFRLYLGTVCAKGELVRDIEDLGVQVRYYPCIRRNLLFKWITPYQVFRLSRWMREERIDIVHTHLFLGGLIGRVAALLARVPAVIHTEHNTYYWKRFYHVGIDRILAKFTEKIIAVSQAVQDFTLKQEGISPDKFTVIYNGIDYERFDIGIGKDRIREEFKIPLGAPLVGSIGRLVPQKGFKNLLLAAAKVLEEIPETKFLIVGDGPERRNLEVEACRLGISEDIIFTGFRRDIPQILSTVDLFVLASLWEGMGLVLLEAMAAGRPVVATAVGPIPEIIEDKITGVLTPPSDPDSLALAIISLLKDRGRTDRMGEIGRSRVRERFGIKRMAEKIEGLYLISPTS